MVEKSRKTIYISGKITDTTDYMERFAKAQQKLEAQGFSVINPALVNSMLPKDTPYEDYMKVSFALLDIADAVYMLEGWEDSPGACREHAVASLKKKKILYADDKLPMKCSDMEQPEKCRFYHDAVCCYPIDDELNCPNYPGNEWEWQAYGNTTCKIE